MITHNIQRYHAPRLTKERKLAEKEDEQRRNIFDRAWHKFFKNSSLQFGEALRIKGTNKIGHIIGTVDYVEEVEWEGYKPKFLEVFIPSTQETILCHPSDLKEIS